MGEKITEFDQYQLTSLASVPPHTQRSRLLGAIGTHISIKTLNAPILNSNPEICLLVLILCTDYRKSSGYFEEMYG